MNTDKIDLSVLDNADADTLARIMQNIAPADNKEKEHIFRLTQKMYKLKMADETTVGGVEQYKPFRWQRIASIAACMVLVGGAVGAGSVMLKKQHLLGLASELCESAENEQNGQFLELQLHEAPVCVENMEEAQKTADEHTIEMPWDGRYGVDRAKYVQMLSDGDYDSIESKSYIYHLMLNSFLYYHTVQGSYNIDDNYAVDFAVDLDAQESYSKRYYRKTGVGNEEIACDGKVYNVSGESTVTSDLFGKEYNINADAGTYKTDTYEKIVTLNLTEDNFRHIDTEDGDKLLSCPDIICGGTARLYLLPYSFADSYMMDFDCWNITGLDEIDGRVAAVITGTNEGQGEFEARIDILTGIMLEIDSIDINGEKRNTKLDSL